MHMELAIFFCHNVNFYKHLVKFYLSKEQTMERTAAVSAKCFYVKQNVRRKIKDKKVVSTFVSILKDCLTLSAVILIGATLTVLLGS